MGADQRDGTESTGLGWLLTATLLLPTPDAASTPGTWTLEARDVLSVLMVEDDEGLAMPAFTSTDALAAWQPEGGIHVEREAGWLFGVASADESGRVLIDPGSPSAIVLGPGEVAALAAGVDPSASSGAGGGGQFLIATPSEPLPDEIAIALHDALAAEPAVVAGKLLLLEPAGEERQFVVFVDFAAGTDPTVIPEAMPRIIDRIVSATDEAGGLRFMVVTDEWRTIFDTSGMDLFSRA